MALVVRALFHWLGGSRAKATGFLQAVGDGAVPKPPFAQEGPPALLDLRGRRRVNHVGVVGRDLFVQPLRGMDRSYCPCEIV